MMSSSNVGQQEEGTRSGPVSPGDRIQSADILRGLAILGILLMNIASFSGQAGSLEAWSEAIDRAVFILTRLLVEAKFYSLFSFLFGWGMAIQMDRLQKRGVSYPATMLRRLAILFLMGVIHAIFIWSGDILAVYALCGVILLLFRSRSDRFLLAASAAFMLAAILIQHPSPAAEAFRSWYAEKSGLFAFDLSPGHVYVDGSYSQVTRVRAQEFLQTFTTLPYTFGKVFAMFLLGFFIGKRGLLRRAEENPRWLDPLLWTALALGLTLNGFYVLTLTGQLDLAPQQSRFLGNAVRTIGAPVLMLAYFAAILRLMRDRNWAHRLAAFGDVGRMALTNYILQSIVATLLFYGYGLGLYGRVDPTFTLALTLTLYSFQVRLSRWWLGSHRFGPLEWAWRSLTYGKLQPWSTHAYVEDRPPLMESITSRLRLISPAHVLAALWIAFSAWAAALLIWDARLDQKLASLPPIQQAAVEEPEEGFSFSSEGTEQTAESQPRATPILDPSVYEPSALLRSGDLYAFGIGVDVERTLETIEELSAAGFSGRQAGTPGGYDAGTYIARQFAELGLQPAGEQGTFFQSFPVDVLRFSETPSMRVRHHGGTGWERYTFLEDFAVILRQYAGGGSARGQVIWANNCAHDDFDSVVVLKKIVICRESPGVEADREALEHGAAGLLLMIDPEALPLDFSWPNRQALVPEPIPMFRINKATMEDLLKGTDRSLSDLLLSYKSITLDIEAWMEAPVSGQKACSPEGCIGRNVLGVIPGRDPENAHELIVIGAHYDHMGASPDGTYWPGANDDASGVALLLEIARLWQEHGYAPRRSVLFAAWDAEELGLVGSQHYVDQPVFPLEDTVAMLQLDMVGAGSEQLFVDGGGALESTLIDLAGQFGLETRTTNHGRSDHGPFQRAGVPANLLIWFGGDGSPSTYHRPSDVIENIEIQKLASAGKVTHLALLSLAEGEPALQELLGQRGMAMREDDLQAFGQTSSEGQSSADSTWFAGFQSLGPDDIELRVRSVRLIPGGSVAFVDLRYTVPTPSGEERLEKSLTWPVRFVSTADGWRWNGTYFSSVESIESLPTEVFISHGPGVEAVPEGLEQQIMERFMTMTEALGLPQETHLDVQLFGNAETLRASTSPSLSSRTKLWTEPGELRLVYDGSPDSDLLLDRGLAHTLLTELGFPAGYPAWLWDGLPLLFEETQDPQAFQRARLKTLRDLLEDANVSNEPVASWAAVSYLRDQAGWEALGEGLARTGDACRHSDCSDPSNLDSALQEGFGLTSRILEVSWKSAWGARIRTAQTALDELLALRNEAWNTGDLSAFLDTVDPRVPGLIAEQRHWFQASQSGDIRALHFSGTPLLLSDDGLQAEVMLEIDYVDDAGEATTRTTKLEVHCPQIDQGLRWAGNTFETVETERISIHYPEGEVELAQHILSMTDPILTDVPRALEIEPELTYQIKLYTDSSTYQSSLSPLAQRPSGAVSWAMANPSVRLFIPGGRIDQTTAPTLAKALIRSALLQSGVDSEWLLRALSLDLSPLFDEGRTQQQAATQLFELFRSEAFVLDDELSELPPETELSPEENVRIDALAWDVERFLRYSFDEGTFQRFLQQVRAGVPVDSALLDVAGLDSRSLLLRWWQSFKRGHAQEDWIETMMSFKDDTAMAIVRYLADDSFEGRPAGSPASEEAVRWIAERFKAYGLAPPFTGEMRAESGDPGADPSTESEPGTEVDRSYLQPVPLRYTELTGAPTLRVTDSTGEHPESFVYRSDFRFAEGVFSAGGSVEGALVWVLDDTYAGMELNGKIVVRPKTDVMAEDVRRAIERGAAGLLFVGGRAGKKELLEKSPLLASAHDRESIPVLELTQEGFEKLRSAMDVKIGDLYNGPPAQLFETRVRIQIPFKTQVESTSYNVVGLLPGSNPDLAEEVIILSAHSDHVGYEPASELCETLTDSEADLDRKPCTPDGYLRYPGENDDASGVAVLLEIARLWHVAGYHPQRSVLFAVWTAQEHGELGSRYFLQHPALPAAQVRAVLHLDGVGGGTGYYLEAHYDWDTDAEPLFYLFASEQLTNGHLSRTGESLQNDHSVFQAQGIPSLLLRWRGSNNENLPYGYDDVVEPSRLGTTGRMVGLALMMMAR